MTPPVTPPSWLARFAVPAVQAVLLAAWLFYYLDNLPLSAHIGDGSLWVATGDRQAQLHGVAAGPLLSVEIGSSRQVRLVAPIGSTLTGTGPGAVPATRPLVFRMVWNQHETPSLSLALGSIAAGSGTALTFQAKTLGGQPGLAVVPSGAALIIDMAVAPDPRDAEPGGIALLGSSGPAPLPRLRLVTPAGAPVEIYLPGETSVRADLGRTDDSSVPLPVRALTIGDAAVGGAGGGGVAIGDLVCGSPRDGVMLWQKVFPSIDIDDCRPGGLTVSRLVADKGVSVSAAGVGFVRKDGKTRVWTGMQFVSGNLVLKALLTALIGGLIGWVGVAIGPRAKA